MSLAARAQETRPQKGQGLPCPIAQILELADDEDRTTLQRWFDTPVGAREKRSDRQIAEDLTAEYGPRMGRVFGRSSVQPHRARACRCFTGTPKT